MKNELNQSVGKHIQHSDPTFLKEILEQLGNSRRVIVIFCSTYDTQGVKIQYLNIRGGAWYVYLDCEVS